MLDEIRRTVDCFPNRFVMGEFSEEPERCGAFAAPIKGSIPATAFRCCMPMFWNPNSLKTHFAMLARHEGHWPSVAFCNHDVMRTLTRFGGKNAPPSARQTDVGSARIAQGHRFAVPGRRARTAGSRSSPRSAQGPCRRSLLSAAQRPRRLPHADAVGCGPASISASRPARRGCRWRRSIARSRSRARSKKRAPRCSSRGPFSPCGRSIRRCVGARSSSGMYPARCSSSSVASRARRVLCVFNMSAREGRLRAGSKRPR